MKTQQVRLFAVPLSQGVLSAHFGHCDEFVLVEVAPGLPPKVRSLLPPEHTPGAFPAWLARLGVTDVLTGGIGQRAIDLFAGQNIQVFSGLPQKKPLELVEACTAGSILPGASSCGHEHGGEIHSNCRNS